ncbi:probable aspartyl aminopeptidase [Nymphaea colorata]|uniref:probable aspartyl aminopeptidase n=1 Tax=Nymphaea colorata TaxID=210225 RepID=UPI00129D3657|nr:probable aspartyl aminopeptidase [Nymphaea colorata]
MKPVLDSKAIKDILDKHLHNEGKIFSKHNEGIVRLISSEIGVKSEKIIDFDLSFADSNPAQLTENPGSFINIAALFDHEECGSESAQGAGSNIVIQSLYRIYKLLATADAPVDGFERTIQRSFLISADMAHAVHPNYSEKHQSAHSVGINQGIVAKINYNQRYATDLVSGSLLKILAEKEHVPLQEFVVRNDSPCGTTIGPIVSSKTGIKTVDVGAPMWGMHSIRETGGVLDGAYYQDLFVSFYKNFEKINHDLLEQ